MSLWVNTRYNGRRGSHTIKFFLSFFFSVNWNEFKSLLHVYRVSTRMKPTQKLNSNHKTRIMYCCLRFSSCVSVCLYLNNVKETAFSVLFYFIVNVFVKTEQTYISHCIIYVGYFDMSRGRSLYSFCVSFYLLANKIFTSFWFYDTQNLCYTHTHIVWYGVSMQIKWCPNLLFFPVLPLYKKKERKKTTNKQYILFLVHM